MNAKCFLDKDAGERALLLKGPNGGDWGILIGRWTGFRRGQKGVPGVPGDRSAQRKGTKGIRGTPGNPGFLTCRFYDLKNYEGLSDVIRCIHATRSDFKFTVSGG